MIEACKQCERNVLMQIHQEMSLSQIATEQFRPNDDTTKLLIASPKATAHVVDFVNLRAQRYIVSVGPEGGFTDDEMDTAATHGWEEFRMGPAILRIETAALAAAAILGNGQS